MGGKEGRETRLLLLLIIIIIIRCAANQTITSIHITLISMITISVTEQKLNSYTTVPGISSLFSPITPAHLSLSSQPVEADGVWV